MATADSVKAKLQGLIAKANATTGNQDADLTTAVDALIAAIEAGGGGGYSAAYGSFTINSDVKYYDVTHGLGTIPVVLMCWVSTYVNTQKHFGGAFGVRISGFEYTNLSIYSKGSSTSSFYFYPGGTEVRDYTGSCGGATTNELGFTRANENRFRIGDEHSAFSNFVLASGKTYNWVAIG